MKHTRELPYVFSRDELRQLGSDLARANQQVYSLRSDKKNAVASMEAGIKGAEAVAADITRKLNEKSELREIEVEFLLNVPRVGMKTVKRLDTGEETSCEPMTDDERQTTLSFTEVPADAKTAAAGGKGDSKSRRSN